MKSKYDEKVDAKYVSIKKGRVHKTETVKDWLLLDLNRKNEVIGVEILDASKHPVSIHVLGNEGPKFLEIQEVKLIDGVSFEVEVPQPKDSSIATKQMVPAIV